MHGAGTAHAMFHAAIGSPNCCALVELQPESKLGYQHTKGYMNLARLFGLHFYRYQSRDGLTGANGTFIDIDNVTDLVRQAVAAVRTQPTCLHDPRDTTSAASEIPSLYGFHA